MSRPQRTNDWHLRTTRCMNSVSAPQAPPVLKSAIKGIFSTCVNGLATEASQYTSVRIHMSFCIRNKRRRQAGFPRAIGVASRYFHPGPRECPCQHWRGLSICNWLSPLPHTAYAPSTCTPHSRGRAMSHRIMHPGTRCSTSAGCCWWHTSDDGCKGSRCGPRGPPQSIRFGCD